MSPKIPSLEQIHRFEYNEITELLQIQPEILEHRELPTPREQAEHALEGNDTIFFISRLTNPTIRQQILASWVAIENRIRPIDPRNIDELDQELTDRIRTIASFVKIKGNRTHPYFSGQDGTVVPSKWKNSQTKKRAVAEFHEKCHEIWFDENYIWKEDILPGAYVDIVPEGRLDRTKFAGCLDVSKIHHSPKKILKRKEELKKIIAHAQKTNSQLAFTEEEIDAATLKDMGTYIQTPGEIVARMGQLKNYFGFIGDEPFTSEHLAYARKHYIKDTGMNNNMKDFFAAITPETEPAFLKMMNSLGT